MTTVNKKEIEKFSRMAEEWWDVEGKFKPLHKFNPIRIKYIKESVIENFKLQNNEKLPLNGINLLDIGCGGGLLSEPMCRLGATVTGIDASAKNIEIAKIHAKKNNLNINYIGTHEWEKFIKPDDLKNILSKFDMTMIKTDGVKFNPILDKWSLSKDTSINYISKFIKN